MRLSPISDIQDTYQTLKKNLHRWFPLGRWLSILSLVVGVFVLVFPSSMGAIASPLSFSPSMEVTDYQYQRPSADGIGKVYLGREIAQVMGHRGALWLERSSRERDEQPQRIIEAIALQPTDVVADIGAGTGYFSFRMAPLVPDGKVLAVDIQPEMLDIIEFLKEENRVTNVVSILASPDDPHLPDGVDLVLMVDAYHEFAYPKEVMTAVVRALNPGGRVVLAEYRGENPFIPIKRLHKMTQRQVRRELTAVGLRWVKTEEMLPRQHLLTFEKPSAET
ncbi:MAG: class I SAM-dependent methyltransferase [Synechococcales bacterium]|nr:class I SAM-dependent methyltransferase [Synechococcales bacterium]